VIEAEIKALVRDQETVRGLLRERAAERVSRYHDTYYDWPGRELAHAGRELRVRVVDEEGEQRCLLTYKAAPVDPDSGSKPETESPVGDAGAVDAILLALGFTHLVAFDKHCVNFTFTASGRPVLTTLATVPELTGTYIEIETTATGREDLGEALDAARALLDELGIPRTDLTNEEYTQAVMRTRDTTT
jgi:adenylate cyclase, class 2